MDDFAAPPLESEILGNSNALVDDLWTSFFLDVDNMHAIELPDEVRSANTGGRKRKKRKGASRSDAKSLSKVTKKVPILNPKFDSFFSDFARLLNEGDCEELTALVKDVCDPDIVFEINCPEFERREVGFDSMIRFFRALLISFPDIIRTEGELQLSHDDEGVFFSSEFKYTGTRSVKSATDREFMSDEGLLSLVDKGDFTDKQLRTIHEIDAAEKKGHRVAITVKGFRKAYVNLHTDKFKKYWTSYKFTELRLAKGEVVNIVLDDTKSINSLVKVKESYDCRSLQPSSRL
jgi:hypothetical protein